VTSSSGNRRSDKPFLGNVLYSGPVAFNLAVLSLLLNLCLAVMLVFLWRYDMPSKLAALQARNDHVEELHAEQKRAIHFLRKEVQFASSRVLVSAVEGD
jgi:hypothetical protein